MMAGVMGLSAFADCTITYDTKDNPATWTTVKIYTWDGGNSTDPSGSWPGAAMTQVAGTTQWTYTYKGDSYPNKVLFDNGNSSGTNQTDDFLFVADATYTYNGRENATMYDYTVYFNNTSNWAKVYVYSWAPTVTEDWPGTELQKDSDGLYVWSFQTDDPNPPTFGGFKFNPGGDDGAVEFNTFVNGGTYYGNGSFEEGKVLPGGTIPEPEIIVYVRGDNINNAEAWGTDYPMTKQEEGIYVWEPSETTTITGAFKCASSDWSTINAGANSQNANITVGTPYNYTQGSGSNIVINELVTAPKIVLNTNEGTILLTTQSSEEPVPVFYLVGDLVNGEQDWTPGNYQLIFDETDNTYSWEGQSLGSGFKIITSWGGRELGKSDQGNIIIGTPYKYYEGTDSGNFTFENDADVVENPKLTLNLEEGTILLTGTIKQQPITSYHLVGTLNDWTTSNYDYELLPVDGKEGVFSGSWTVPANPESSDLKFKLIAFDGYSVQFGSTGNTFALYGNTKTTISLVSGGDSQDIWCTNWEGGKMSMTLNTLTNQLEIEAPDQPESTPDFLWLVGNFNDWDLSNQEYKLTPVEGQKGAYSGSFSIPTQENLNEDGTLDNNFLKVKIAAGIDDDWSQVYGAGNFALYSNQPYESKMLVTNENFVITNWETGTLTVTVNWDEKEVTFESATQPELTNINTLYLIGAPQGWDINDDSMALTASKDGVFEGTFTIPAGEFEFLFYTELGNWEANYVGANSTSNMELPLTDNVLDYFGDVAFTKSNWKVSGWNGGQVNIMVNLNEMQVSFAGQTTGVDAIFGENGFSYANGIVTVAGASEITVYNVSGQAVARVNGETADLNNLSSGIYVVVAPGLNPVKIVK